jgi:hypothetical protein
MTWAVKLNVPAAVGVPDIAPVEEFSVRPGGREPATIAKVYGGTPPVATRLELYGVPTWPVLDGHSTASDGLILISHLSVKVAPRESVTCAM